MDMKDASTHSSFDPVADPSPSHNEGTLRAQLAACFRLVAHFGLDDLIYNHISVRVPGEREHFLINPYGLLFSEITASCFIKIDLDGNKVEPSDHEVNRAGFVIHSAIHAAREDAVCVLHTHSEGATALSTLEDGLLPISQFAMRYQGHMGAHDYEGVALDADERARLISDIGPHNVLLSAKPRAVNGGAHNPGSVYSSLLFRESRARSASRAGGHDRRSAPRPSPINGDGQNGTTIQ